MNSTTILALALILSLVGHAVQVWLLVRAYELPHNAKAAQVILEADENHRARVVDVEKDVEALRKIRDGQASYEAAIAGTIASLEQKLDYLKGEAKRH